MKKNGRFVISALSAALSALAFAGTPAMLSGCANTHQSEEEAAKSGSINLALTASASSGAEYRLRDGVFKLVSLSSGETQEVSTEEHLDESAIVLELEEGAYAINLLSGYWLERTSTGAEEPADAGVVVDAGIEVESPLLGDLHRQRQLNPSIKFSDRASQGHPLRGLGVALSASELGPVESELLSPNPMLVDLVAGERTDVEFVFRVGGESTGSEKAELGLGFSIVEDQGCEPDQYEPNDTAEKATAVELPISATSCGLDDDFYRFPSPVAAGELLRLTIAFSHADADIDAVLANEQLEPVAFGESTTDNETLTTLSDGGEYQLYVFPVDGEAEYSVFAEAVDDTPSDCCAVSEFPGCTEPDVESCVCELAPFCCEGAFDEICSQLALTQCGAECPLGEGDCCEANGGLGCNDPEVNSCVCGVDSGCCTGEYDELCVEQAQASCGLVCEALPSDSDCCSAGENAGCMEPAIEQCVCEIDPICCARPFDENCVDIAVGICAATCEEG